MAATSKKGESEHNIKRHAFRLPPTFLVTVTGMSLLLAASALLYWSGLATLDVTAGIWGRGGKKPEAPSDAETSYAAGEGSGVFLDPERIKVISEENPRALLYEGFLTENEANTLIEEANPRLEKSGVVDKDTGKPVMSSIRTSSGCFLPRGTAPTVDEKVALLTQTPKENAEATQVLRYEHEEEYKPHFDYFFHEQGMRNNRLVTALLYLADVEYGGETVFPNVEAPQWQQQNSHLFTECAMKGLSVRPRKGDALVFWSMKPGGELDAGSNHGSCPVVQGEKWTATKWIHVAKAGLRDAKQVVHKEEPRYETEDCSDGVQSCKGWAEQGECTNNPGYMLHSCRFSCRVCEGHIADD